jgi:CRISPR-associated endonuclease Cas1 subtype II
VGFRTIIINTYSKISLQEKHLVYKTPQKTEKIFLPDINTIIVETQDVAITSALIAEIIHENIKLIFCDDKRIPAGEIMPYFGSHDTSKKVRLQSVWTDEIKGKVWSEIIRQKIENQAANLVKNDCKFAKNLRIFAKNIAPNDATNMEAIAAKNYFAGLFGEKFWRDQGGGDKINAALNYGYSLILATVSREISKCGYISQLGLNHRNYFNPLNLACDFMEPFRAITDDIVFRNQNEDFAKIKLKLLMIFGYQYEFAKEKLHFDTMVEKFVKRMFAAIENEDFAKIPEFKFDERI